METTVTGLRVWGRQRVEDGFWRGPQTGGSGRGQYEEAGLQRLLSSPQQPQIYCPGWYQRLHYDFISSPVISWEHNWGLTASENHCRRNASLSFNSVKFVWRWKSNLHVSFPDYLDLSPPEQNDYLVRNYAFQNKLWNFVAFLEVICDQWCVFVCVTEECERCIQKRFPARVWERFHG